MAGIYVHIPFCKKACHYCNFHFSTSLGLKDSLVEAIMKEIDMRHNYLDDKEVNTIYFGGGTPSILSGSQLGEILNRITKTFKISSTPEITLEANPDDLSKEKIKTFIDIGINRLSIGVQSFHEEDLQWMNRSHNNKQSVECIALSQETGIENISIDLIFGSPTTTTTKWIANLNKVIELNIPHLSCYGLTVEKNTALEHMIKSGLTQSPDSIIEAEQFKLCMAYLTENDYSHYEISNYCKDEKYAIHNTNYWSQIPYLGIGPSAHSYNKESRSWNIAHNKKYIDSINNNILPSTKELLTESINYNEYVMTGLRTKWGCSINTIKKMYPKFIDTFQDECKTLVAQNKIIQKEDSYILTTSGKLVADTIISQLFATEDDL